MDWLGVALLALNIACLVLFQWGRLFYFRRTGAGLARGGLGTLGTLFALGQIPLVGAGALLVGPARLGVALALYAAAIALFVWAMRSHAQNRPGIAYAPGEVQKLVTHGAYQVARHPFYLAYLLFWAGSAIASPWFAGAVLFVVMGALYSRTAALEEAQLRASALFGANYAAYSRRVGRFVRWVR